MQGAETEVRKFLFDVSLDDVLAQPVFAPDGAILCDKNARLTTDMVNRLERWGVSSVLVKNPDFAAESLVVPSSGDSATSQDANAAPEFELTLGSLEPEEPIAWEEIARATPPPPARPPQAVEEAIAEFENKRPPVTRVMADPEPFVYDAKQVQEAKRVVHEVHHRAVKETSKAIAAIARRESGDLNMMRHMIIQLVDTGTSNQQVLSALTSLSRFDDYLLAHAVTSTVYAIMTGYMLGMTQSELYELAECCLLHDIGMSRVPSAVWKKPGRLTQGEMLEIQKHTISGADILHDARGVSFMAEMVAYQHHERFDGSGYPKGRKGSGINEFARIIAMVDVYTAMTSPRPYRDRVLGYDAMNFLLVSASLLFDPQVVKAFLRCMALYPIGSVVELSNGAVGIVVSANPLFPYRPFIKLLKDEKGRPTDSTGDLIDLLKTRDIGIVQQISESAINREAVWKAF